MGISQKKGREGRQRARWRKPYAKAPVRKRREQRAQELWGRGAGGSGVQREAEEWGVWRRPPQEGSGLHSKGKQTKLWRVSFFKKKHLYLMHNLNTTTFTFLFIV